MPHPSWPDPSRPGTPPDPDTAQYHWLLAEGDHEPFPVRWSPNIQGWDPAEIWVARGRVGEWAYVGVCPWPRAEPAKGRG